MKNSKIINLFKGVSILLVLILNLAIIPTIKAGEYQNEKDIMTRLKASTFSSHDFTFSLSAGNTFDANDTITINFNTAGFTVYGASSTVSDFTFSDNYARTIYNVTSTNPYCTGATGTSSVAIGIASNVVTVKACTGDGFTSSAAGASVEIKYGTAAGGTNWVSNPSAGANKVIYLGGIDTGSFAVDILSDDQVVVTATVEPTFTFTISTTTCALGTLSTAATSSCSYTASSTSNAAGGYVTSMVAASSTLVSGSNDINAVTDGAVTAGQEEYGIRITGNDKTYATSTDMLVPVTATTIAEDTTGPISNQYITVTHIVAISASTLAGSYSQTVTLISTGTY